MQVQMLVLALLATRAGRLALPGRSMAALIGRNDDRTALPMLVFHGRLVPSLQLSGVRL